MNKIKELKDLTIKEWELFQELIKEEIPDLFSVLELFGYKPANMEVNELFKAYDEVVSCSLPVKGVHKVYTIKGRKFKSHLNITTIKAAQFIDFQVYMQNFKLEEVLSVFLVPMKKNWYGRWIEQKYGEGYDPLEVIDYLYNNFTIGEANELSAFFLTSSNLLLQTIHKSSQKKLMKMKIKVSEEKIKMLHTIG